MAGQIDNSEGTSLLKEGLRMLEAGDIDAATALFSRAIEIEPGRAAAYRLRGSAHLRKRAYDSAIADLEQAIALGPKDAVAYYLRGRARQLMKDSAGAVADYDQAIALKPDYLKAFRAREAALKMSEIDGVKSMAKSPPLSPRWQRLFALIEKRRSGKKLAGWEHVQVLSFLGGAFAFIYYFILGMHKKASLLLALTLLCLGALLWRTALLYSQATFIVEHLWVIDLLDLTSAILGYGVLLFALVRAKIDYYAYRTRKET